MPPVPPPIPATPPSSRRRSAPPSRFRRSQKALSDNPSRDDNSAPKPSRRGRSSTVIAVISRVLSGPISSASRIATERKTPVLRRRAAAFFSASGENTSPSGRPMILRMRASLTLLLPSSISFPKVSCGPGLRAISASSVLSVWSATMRWLLTSTLAWPRSRHASAPASTAFWMMRLRAGSWGQKPSGNTVPDASGATRARENRNSGPGSTVIRIFSTDLG